MFNIGGGEFLVIGLIALIVLGPQRLPEAARQVGKVMADLRRISSGFQSEIREAFDASSPPATPTSPGSTDGGPAPAPLGLAPLGGSPRDLDAAIASVSAQSAPGGAGTAAKKAGGKRATTKAAAKKTAARKTAATKPAAARTATTKPAAPGKTATTKAATPRKAATKKSAAKKTAAKKTAAVPTAPRRRSSS